MRAEYEVSVTPLKMDLSEHSVRVALQTVVDAGPLFGLVNSAGVALPGPLEYLPIERLRRQLNVNVVGQLLVTQQLLPAETTRYQRQIRQARENAERQTTAGLPPARVAGIVVETLTSNRPKPRQVIGRDARIAALLNRIRKEAVRTGSGLTGPDRQSGVRATRKLTSSILYVGWLRRRTEARQLQCSSNQPPPRRTR